jgi:hypothetical protein
MFFPSFFFFIKIKEKILFLLIKVNIYSKINNILLLRDNNNTFFLKKNKLVVELYKYLIYLKFNLKTIVI